LVDCWASTDFSVADRWFAGLTEATQFNVVLRKKKLGKNRRRLDASKNKKNNAMKRSGVTLKMANSRRVVRILIFTIYFFAWHYSMSQNLRFDHLSVKQGLSQGNVWDIYQDKLGFIWIATEDGLNLYDGYNFTVFRNNPADSLSISNNNIDRIVEDSNGNLWVATQQGLNFYNRKLDRFERHLHNPKNNGSISNDDVGYVYIDKKGRVWAGTNHGLNLFDEKTKTWKHFFNDATDPKSISDNIIEVIFEDSMNRLWIGTGNGGLNILNSDNATFERVQHDPSNPSSLSSNKIVCMIEDTDHVLWVGTFDGGLNRLDPLRKTVVRYKHVPGDENTLGANYVYDISQNTAGELWVATDGALNRFDIRTGQVRRIIQIQGDETTLSSNIITRAYFDANNRMWVGTRFGGVNVFDNEKYAFKHFKYSANDRNTINHDNITAFAEDNNGNIWIGTDGGGLNYYNRKTGKFSNFKDLTTNPKILAVAKDTRGGLWLGMWAGGLNYFDPRTHQVRKYLHDPANNSSLSDNNIFDILVDRSGNVWIGTFGNGLCRYNPATDDFTRYNNDPANSNSFAGSVIVKLMEDSFGKIWIATEQNGVDELDPATGIFTHHPGGNNPGQLSGNSVFALWEDSKKRIWVGTNGSGLNLYDRDTKSFKTFRQKDGLPNDAIMGILEDDKGQLWISTNKGVSRMNAESKTFRNYTESDGLQSDQFNRWSYLKLSTGELLFGGTNGFNIFNPSTMVDNTFKPPVYITDFKLFNKPVVIGEGEILKTNILFSKEIVLGYAQNILSFEFTALNYRQSEKNQYKYMLEGFQDEWIDAGTERKVSYTNLSPGEYNFRVIASNNDGVWNNEGASLKIVIIPPFWWTWWFVTLLVCAIVFGIVNYVRFQKRKALKQQEELRTIIEARTSEIQKQGEDILKKNEQEQLHNWITSGLAKFGEIISKHKGSLEELSREILGNLVRYVHADQGTISIANKEDESDEYLMVLSTFGVNHERLKTKRIEIGEGLIGSTYKDKEKKTLRNLPGNYITVESGLGKASPATLILLPLKTDDGEIQGVIELAFLNEVTDDIQSFLDKVAGVIALNVHAANLNHITTRLLQQAKEQTEELQAQEEEMRQNMEELEATQEELKRREQEYLAKIKSLESELQRYRS
jgi:ligand-binding sensor domain-containing protein